MQPSSALDIERANDSGTTFNQGIKAGLPIAMGYMPIALTFGLVAKSTGLEVWEAVFMSLLVFAGASQFIALNLIALSTGVIGIIITTFIVNIRHFLMSASVQAKIDEKSKAKKALLSFGLTDETFSVLSLQPGKVSASFTAGVMLVSYSSWVIFSGVGHAIGASLPTILQESMSIALYAMFVGLLVPSFKTSTKVITLAVTAALINSMLTLSAIVQPGWAIVISTLTSAILVECVAYSRGEGQQ
ncbi:AzlC family ABC transporter permease [Mangrovibacillus cuniculi]|uniref:AzlC family ABC transporter permease n=1 Tax=Mangrovibacillus cuniculi TaxID=2593652 RepID=A0A7S8HER3_9BACI|nr:AzlC family ABC transporter permease [Mangrovibacillus cuniculi]QPC46013.1 AzlC family ABC transporter permease [Mangrovibacillus cuniculi]